ncbi:hypothetical protein IV203_030166 [Nitzschia inconspicua]|uniref:Uncharacterized protein n=1 Tax=Nitzschia inconspicua TaxID=303405 RepID=A0A9K3Q1X9_9STRA|nr:hypothetical protein IV203_030166 [Nitzschia inconspicua]
MRNAAIITLFLTIAFRLDEAFLIGNNNNNHHNNKNNNCKCSLLSGRGRIISLLSFDNVRPSTTSSLYRHRFNGGYDPSFPLTWTPKQAAEFTIYHHGEPKYIGLQLKMAIQHWTGSDLAEFLTRLYLGQVTDAKVRTVSDSSSSYRTSTTSYTSFGEESRNQEVRTTIIYEPQNVRIPQWKGLETREGVLALLDLLKEALSPATLDSQEIARFAEAFLLKEYKWPSRKRSATGTKKVELISNKDESIQRETVVSGTDIVFEQDSFCTCGHSKTLARILWWIRKEKSKCLTWDDFAGMLTLPECERKEVVPMQLTEFYQTLLSLTPLSTSERTLLVGRMALGGWNPSEIPKFLSRIFPDNNETTSSKLSLDDDGTFLDIPSASELIPSGGKKEDEDQKNEALQDDQSILDTIEEQVLLVTTLKRATLSIRSEYDQLVQSYWKQVEIPTSKKSPSNNDKKKEKSSSTNTSKGVKKCSVDVN